MTFKGAELNYPVHEKEMLAIIRALKKWRSDLIGIPFVVYMDHKTLENFNHQKDLSRRQARWMEFLSQYDCKIIYLKGDDNSMADALSQTTFDAEKEAAHPWSNDRAEPIAAIYGHSPFECAKSLSHCKLPREDVEPVASILSMKADHTLLKMIKDGYKDDG